jgi:hypothetical protein
MPYEWVDPEMFLEHKGVKVWHCYKDDVVSGCWFTTDPSDCDTEFDNGAQFDAWDLIPKESLRNGWDRDVQRMAIEIAIETSALTQDGLTLNLESRLSSDSRL